MSARERLILSLIALVAVYLIGTAGYMILEDGVGLGDAAYMTIITISTVGFTEAIQLDPAGRFWTAIIILFGVGTASLAVSSLFSMAVSGEIRALRGRYRMQSNIDRLTNHVIICGCGRMGLLAASDLAHQSVPVVGVESNPNVARELDEGDMLYVLGDATEDDTLRKAGVLRAGVLVATLPTDADNVYVTLSARQLRPDLRIIARAGHPATETKLRRAGADSVVCPQIIGAHRIAHLIARPHLVEFIEVAARGVELEISEHVVGADCPLVGQTLRESDLRQRSGGMVVAIKRADGTTTFSPVPDETIRESDTLIVIGTSGLVDRLKALNL